MALFEKLIECDSRKLEDKLLFLKNYVMDKTECPEDQSVLIHRKLSQFNSLFKQKYEAARYIRERFISQNQSWLQTVLEFPIFSENSSNVGGRPPVDFASCSERSKRRKTQNIRSTVSTSELMYAAQMNLRREGSVDAAVVVKELQSNTPATGTEYRKAYKTKWEPVVQLTNEEALSLFLEGNFTTHQYQLVREANKKRFPSYKKIQEAKKLCYPNDLDITESCAEVKLQSLLDHSVGRLMQFQNEVLETLTVEERAKLTLISKWGCDGSSGHASYKQRFENSECSDESIFLTSVVPLQIISGDIHSKTKKIIWQNPRPGSPRFCRPIKIRFVKETKEQTAAEINYIEHQINQLVPTTLTSNTGLICIVKHVLNFTMIDGKVCNVATSTSSSQKCYICGATSQNFNKFDEMLTRQIDISTFNLGISVLHAWIRFFEYNLHLSYKLPIKSWQARGEQKKAIVAERKKQIQKSFQEKLGLLVDKPKPGFGSTNDGNTARRFFEHYELSSEVTGIDQTVIYRQKVILQTLASSFHIKTDLFREYCLDTAKLLIETYPWYNMPTTVHKILFHSAEVIDSFLLPIGQMTEEAQEALNKTIKKYREGFSRKFSRKQTMEDVFKRLLLSSDPLISNLRKLPKKKIRSFDGEVIKMLVPPAVDDSEGQDQQDSDSDVQNNNSSDCEDTEQSEIDVD